MHDLRTNRCSHISGKFYWTYILVTMIVLQPCSAREIKLGVIAFMGDPSSFQSLKNQGSAINIAYDALVRDGVITNDTTFKIIVRDASVQKEGVGNAVDLIVNEEVDILMGSPSSRVTIPAAHLTAFWKFPHITWVANSYELANKNLFTTLARTTGPLTTVGDALVVFFKEFGWENMGILVYDYGLCSYCAEAVKNTLPAYNITIRQNIAYPANTVLTPNVIDSYMSLLKQSCRIIFICTGEETIRDFMLRAYEKGMCNGDFLFIYPIRSPPEKAFWKVGDQYDGKAQMAFRYLMFFVTAEYIGAGGKQRLEHFLVEVLDRLAKHPWNNTEARDAGLPASSDAQHLYDATYLVGLWVNHTTETGTDMKNGTAFSHFCRNKSFPGLSGPCDMGSNADRVPYFWIFQYDERGEPYIAATLETNNRSRVYGSIRFMKMSMSYYEQQQPVKFQRLSEEGTFFSWYTADDNPPPDLPACGFLGELCIITVKDNSVTVAVISITLIVILSIAASIGYILRKRQIEHRMLQSVWKINIADIELQKSKVGLGSRINMKLATSQSVISQSSGETLMEAGANIALTNVGMFQGQLVAVRNLSPGTTDLTTLDLVELKAMREMVHDNINPFLGASFDCATPCALFLYCQKGSLQDVLENDDIQLDMTFKYSLTNDLVQGIQYIHGSKLGSHGRLKSTNCLVDNRWVLKITDYGLSRFTPCHISQMEEHQKYKSLLWTSPELLISPTMPPNGTKAGDVYSLGIILHEIFYRLGTFAGKTHMTVKDIIFHVKMREKTACRPEIFSEVQDVTPAIVKLMQLCWMDEETDRPTIQVIRSYVKKNIHGIGKNIMDIVLKRLEKYASNLEDLVDQRTQQLMLEKQKTDRLLYRMLPQSCAEKLKMGEPVHPEIFDSATVFFSDIVGFTTISAKSSPIQVVDLLNDLYTCFDSVIANYDAYKVETIGDAYLVVSGVPNRNGDQHAGEIADMSLDILDEVGLFVIQHMPSERLRVRIGLHTGPCCAGVVGLSMPRYCLFGDTINTASRMESNGEAQKIHISEACCSALNKLQFYHTALRGEMPIKGKGMMCTYWLEGKDGRTPKGKLVD